MNEFNDEFIKANNERILKIFPPYQPRFFSEKKEETKTNELSNEERLFLTTAFTHIGVSLTGLQKKLGWSAERIVRICKSAQSKGLCSMLELNLSGGRGGLSKFLVLTDKAFNLLNLPGYLKKSRGGTNEEHQYLQRLISDNLNSKSYKTETERNI